MEQKIREFMRQTHMVEPGDRVLAGVSGGADSVCMLLVLCALQKQLGFVLEAVHIEHGIRGEESVRDAQFVEALCGRLSVPFTQYSVNVPFYAAEHQLGLEEAARHLRYECLRKKAQETGAPVRIALAHHMEDNAETILFQMARGSGILGMCGIPPVRREGDIAFIRPLLASDRQEIEEYLEAAHQDFCIDSTNGDESYSRNRIRSRVLPEIRQVNAQAVFHICQSAGQLSVINDYLHLETQKAVEKLVTSSDGTVMIDGKQLKKLHPAIRNGVVRDAVFRAAGKRKDIAAVHIGDVLSLLDRQSGREVSLPYGLTAKLEYDTIRLERAKASGIDGASGIRHPEKLLGQVSDRMLEECKHCGSRMTVPIGEEGAELSFTVRTYEGSAEEIPKKTYTKCFDYDMIKDGFLVRSRRQGDYFVQDLKGHHKKLSNYFIDEKIPAHRRDEMPLLAIGSEVIWLIGGRISENYKVTKDTVHILEIQYNGGKSYGLQNKT